MRKLTDSEKKERGWFCIGKTKFFWRLCNFCGEEYVGEGKYFCGKSCSLKSRPFYNFGDKNFNYSGGKETCVDCDSQVSDYSERRCWDCYVKNYRGKNHHSYIVDRTKLRKSEKKHLDGRYREWMFAVKDRDNWTCRINDDDCRGRLESHHILNWMDYPELRYRVNNGITLCLAHHPRGRANEEAKVEIFQYIVSEISK